NITDLLANSEISMAINTSEAKESSKDDGKEIRRSVLKMNVPYFTTVAAATASVEAIKVLKTHDVSTPKSIQEFLND
ncbi:MAG: carbamoyl-phosphate synthase large chain, partial [Aliarcobacter sp.]|nr:carbamoyl-phosphate synthase large chain [Aliarcobacter sp.]